ncbi:serine hydrolase domain-containing protein [Saccharibacillus sacchari]|uniref:Serine hydrolase domain-containing protein n=1 Tax=Saccharibacillus sacchari TaxID=456493 RepID=A0ACC6PH96_9BACL
MSRTGDSSSVSADSASVPGVPISFGATTANDPCEDPRVAQLLDWLETESSSGRFNGCVRVVDRGKLLLEAAAGQADFRTGRPLTTDSLFELASVTKPMTAIGAMILAERGLLDYRDPVAFYLPQLPYRDVTLRQLLSHTSGLPDYMELIDRVWDVSRIARNPDVLQLLKLHHPQPLFPAGTDYAYSNTGYVLLASVIEAVSGIPYAEFMEQEVFRPAGMTRTTVYNRRLNPREIEDLAHGFVALPGASIPFVPDERHEFDYVVYLDGIQGDGTIHSTVSDLWRLDQALREGLLLSPESQALFLSETGCDVQPDHGDQSQPSLSRAFGWFAEPSPHPSIGVKLSHGGGWPGYASLMIRYPERAASIILLTNLETESFPMSAWQEELEQIIGVTKRTFTPL